MGEKNETCKAEATPREAVAVEQQFENSGLHGMDVLETNIFLLLEKRHRDLGPQGAAERALTEAETFAKMADKMPLNWEGKTASLFFYLKELASSGTIAKLAFTNGGEVVIFGKNGGEILKFNFAEVLAGAVKADAVQKRVACMEGYRAEAGPSRSGRFSPLTMPDLDYSFVRRNAPPMSRFLGMRAEAPVIHIIEPEFRHKKLCSTYAYMVMEDMYGKEAVERMRLNKSKTPSAWEVRAFFGKNLTATASMKDQFQKTNGPDGRPRLKIKNTAAYNAKLGEIASAVDSGKVPGYITFYLPGTANNPETWDKVMAHNAKTPEAMQSWNSHVGVILGRAEKKEAKVDSGGGMSLDLSGFVLEKLGIKPDFMGLINLEIHKANGAILKIAPNGVDVLEKGPDGQSSSIGMKSANINLESGDTVFWQDILFTHYTGGSGHVNKLAETLTQASVLNVLSWYPYEYLTFDSLSVQKHPDYSPTGFLQLQPGKPVKEQVLKATKMSKGDFEYYMAALEDLGIDVSRARGIDILPTFDMKMVRAAIARKGGISALRSAALKENLGAELSKYPGVKFIVIEGRKAPWDHIRGLFESQFTGKNALSKGERNLILDAVDQSCGNLSFTPPVVFSVGEMIYLTDARVKEIISYVRGLQSRSFGPEDYVRIMEKEASANVFLQRSFDAHVVKFLNDPENDYLKKELVEAKVEIKFAKLDGFEKDYVMRVFAGGKDLRKIAEGERLILRKEKLDEAIGMIFEKRSLQRPNEKFGGVLASYASGVQLVTEVWKIPENVLKLINESYPGDSVEDVIVRNSLYFIYAREQIGGGLRGLEKQLALDYLPERTAISWGDYLVSSVGLFQTRPQYGDLKMTQGQFDKHGLKMPSSTEGLREMLKTNDLAATLIAGERIRENFRIFRGLMQLNGESGMDYFDESFAVMLTTSFNRSPESVIRAVFQNWAYNLKVAAGVNSDLKLSDIDKSPATVEKETAQAVGIDVFARAGRMVGVDYHQPGEETLKERAGMRGEEQLNMQIVKSMTTVVEKLISEGKIKFNGNYKAEIGLILVSKKRFLKSSLWLKIKEWYAKNVDKRGLRFTFKGSEIDRGDGVFSYGTKYLWSHSIDENEKPVQTGLGDGFGRRGSSMHGMCWGRAFKNKERLREIIAQMQGR